MSYKVLRKARIKLKGKKERKKGKEEKNGKGKTGSLGEVFWWEFLCKVQNS